MRSGLPIAAHAGAGEIRGRLDMKIGIIACGAIVRELIAVARQLEWDFELTAIPAQLHNVPDRIPSAVMAKADEWADRFDLLLIGYADCGTAGALDTVLARYPHAVRISGLHCYDFYGGEDFRQQSEQHPGTFYLTDFLARHFDGLVWKGLGLDRHPELLPLYFGNYTHLLYLRQSDDWNQEARAREAAARLGLRYIEASPGLSVLTERLDTVVEARRHGARSAGDGAPPAAAACDG